MNTRRQFVVGLARVLGGIGLVLNPAPDFIRRALAALQRRLLPEGTELQSLINEHPVNLDTRNLKIMSLESFSTMGLTDHSVDLSMWGLVVTGKVKKPLKLSYTEILTLPAVEENALLVCPGFFTIHARWKGIAVNEVLSMAEPLDGVAHVTVHGPEGPYEKVEAFDRGEVESGQVFLAYAVNGQPLPQKHGFPLRAVAADRLGSDWVKFVYKVEAR